MTAAASPPPNVELSCPRCETRLYFPREEVGKQVRCEMCGVEFRLPEYLAAPKFEPKKVAIEPYRVLADDEAIVQVELVSWDCERCATRLSAPAGQAGQKMSCPECGKVAVIPQPQKRPAPPPKPEPYPVEPEGAPPPPPVEYVSTYCSKCWLLLNARRDELDKPIVCPDCGTENTVPPIWRKPAAAPPPVPETYRLLEEDEAIVQEELILVNCHTCNARIHVPVAEANKSVVCPDCKTSLTVPAWKPKSTPAVPEPTTYRILGDDEDWRAPAPTAKPGAAAAQKKADDVFSLVDDDELAPSPPQAPPGAPAAPAQSAASPSTSAPATTPPPAKDDPLPISLSRPPDFTARPAPASGEKPAAATQGASPKAESRRPPTSAIDPLDEVDSGPRAETIDVFCPKCGGRMRARPDQLGQLIACPKCGQTTEAKVGAPSPQSATTAGSPLTPGPPTPPGPPFARGAAEGPPFGKGGSAAPSAQAPTVPALALGRGGEAGSPAWVKRAEEKAQRPATFVPDPTLSRPGQTGPGSSPGQAGAPYVAPPRAAPTAFGVPGLPAAPGGPTYAPRPPRWAVPPDKATPDFPVPAPSQGFGRGKGPRAAPAEPPTDDRPRWSVPPSQWKPRETAPERPAPDDLADEAPRYTFFSGVFHFPWRTDICLRWFVASAGLFVTGVMLGVALPFLLSGTVLIALAIPFIPLTVWTGAWTLCYWSVVFITIVGSTGHGADRIREWPDLGWFERLPYAGFVLGVFLLASLPGYFLDRAVGLFFPTFALLGSLIAFFTFPVFFASAATEGTFYKVLSPQVLAGLKANWRGWLIFFALAAALVLAMVGAAVLATAAGAGAVWLMAPGDEPTFFAIIELGFGFGAGYFAIFAPALMAASFIYARLLGRVMWQSNRVLAEIEAQRDQTFPL